MYDSGMDGMNTRCSVDGVRVHTADEIHDVAARLLNDLEAHRLERISEHSGATVLTLTGELGAGKTTCVQALARVLGVVDTVISPTFVILKRYTVPKHPHFHSLVHLDCYRLADSSEIVPLRLSEILSEPHTLVVVEWPERISEYIPQHAVNLEIAVDRDGTRTITEVESTHEKV
jgi:tRNA threonylcarbamoyladenosine biosynthesis protein TsaE